MSKHSDRLDAYTLFYEELGRGPAERSAEKSNTVSYPAGLSEDQAARLSEDLKMPLRSESDRSNPLQ